MRLTCPNCGAQYEVPDEVIPTDGRDVQCSNCGDTWFQAHGDTPEPVPAADAPAQEPEPDESPVAEPDPDHMADDPDPAPPAPAPQQQPGIETGISEILREEAQREAQLRAAETSEPLESQPNLGLDDLRDDDPEKRAREARDRMARMRGEHPTEATPAAPEGSRRELLPNIEEINSTLRASEDDISPHTAVGPARADQANKKRGGFARGFALIIIAGGVLALVYIKAPNISKAAPQVEPALSSYVTLVDQARLWLDARVNGLPPKPEE